MHITDLLPAGKWAELEKELSEKFGVNCAVNDAAGTRVSGQAFWGNALCPKIQGHKPAASMICSQLSQFIMRELAEKREPVAEQCDAGMTKYAVPVVVNGEFLGAVADRTSGSERYNALCAVFLLQVVERELALSADAVARQWRELAHLTGTEPSAEEPYAAFCAAARAGRLDAQWDAAVAFALHQVIDKVRVTNPDHLDPRHREQ